MIVLRNIMLPGQGSPQALLIQGDRITWIGSDQDASRWQQLNAQIIDGAGMLALPGFNDCHFHLQNGARVLNVLRLEQANSIADVQHLLARYAAANPHLPWLIGRGWRYRLFAAGQSPTRHMLDAVVADRPVLLTAFDGHTAWVNTRALQIARYPDRHRHR
jgi:Predicted metal-dependent hydrolase with the TIM-barrel fold